MQAIPTTIRRATPATTQAPPAPRGFSLVEIMTVLAALGILAAIAYPNYASHVVKARRTEAQASLLELMQQQERHHTDHLTYLASDADTGTSPEGKFKWYSGSTAGNSAYELQAGACAGQTLATCVQLRAVPGTDKVDRSFRDSECETLTLDSEGSQGATGKGDRCWP